MLRKFHPIPVLLSFSSFVYVFLLFLAVPGPHCRAWALSSCSEWGHALVVLRGLLTGVVSPVQSSGSRTRELQDLRQVGSVSLAHRLFSCSVAWRISPA